MYKRISVRFVQELAQDITIIAKKRGLSVNSLISEMAWDFVNDWKKQNVETMESNKTKGNGIEV